MDDDGFKDSWICPRCFRIDAGLADHWRHLVGSRRCMAKTLAPGRLSGTCRCKPGVTLCRCEYRAKLKRRRVA